MKRFAGRADVDVCAPGRAQACQLGVGEEYGGKFSKSAYGCWNGTLETGQERWEAGVRGVCMVDSVGIYMCRRW